MALMEQAEKALNARIQDFQTKLQAADAGPLRDSLVQAIVVYAGIGEAISAYVQSINQYATARFGELKTAQGTLTTEHAELLKSGHALLEELKLRPTDRALRKEIERTQRKMETLQKTLRRGADALQREISPGVRSLDELAAALRQLAEAEDTAKLRRAVHSMLAVARDRYHSGDHPPGNGVSPVAAWERGAVEAVENATNFYAAHARAGTHAILVTELLSAAMRVTPPETLDAGLQEAHAAVARRLAAVAERFRA